MPKDDETYTHGSRTNPTPPEAMPDPTMIMGEVLRDGRATRRTVEELAKSLSAIESKMAVLAAQADELKGLPLKVALIESDLRNVRTITYGAVALVLIAVVGAGIALVVRTESHAAPIPGAAQTH